MVVVASVAVSVAVSVVELAAMLVLGGVLGAMMTTEAAQQAKRWTTHRAIKVCRLSAFNQLP